METACRLSRKHLQQLPNNSDSDGDGLIDGDEVNAYGTDPNDADQMAMESAMATKSSMALTRLILKMVSWTLHI